MTDEAPKTQEEKKPVSIAYSTLNMKQGKKTEEGIESVKTISAKKPYGWFFDIICNPNQIENARTAAAAIYGEITAVNLEMPQDKIIVGITVNEKMLPAQTIMYRLSQQAAQEDLLLGMHKLFDDRRMFLWIGGQPQHPPFEEESTDETVEA